MEIIEVVEEREESKLTRGISWDFKACRVESDFVFLVIYRLFKIIYLL